MRSSGRQYSVVAESLVSGLTAGQASGSGRVTSGKCRPALGLRLSSEWARRRRRTSSGLPGGARARGVLPTSRERSERGYSGFSGIVGWGF